MILRRAKPEDMEQVIKLLESRGIPIDFDNTLTHCLMEEDGKIIGFGYLKINVEAIIALDKTATHRQLHEATHGIINEGIKQAKEQNFDMLHSFVVEDNFDKILQKHFGFQECKGKYLFKKVG